MDLRQVFLRRIAPTVPEPLALEIERAEGDQLYLKDGRVLTDLISGIGVANIGHSHPKVVQAVQTQASQYMHTMVYGEFAQQPQVAYADALCQTLGDQLNMVYWTNSGTEAIEGALKLAKKSTGRTEIISFQNSYHGSTIGAMSAMGNEDFKRAYRPLVPGHHVFPTASQQAIDAIGPNTAAVLIEVIQSESGYTPLASSYLQAVQNACHRHGALLIVDECQTGFYRTGDAFAHNYAGIQPDILVLAKALGGGMPLGAFIADRNLMLQLSEAPILGHLTTFGGHPVSCAAGLAAWQILQKEAPTLQIAAKESLLRELLNACPDVTNITGRGLMLAVYFNPRFNVLDLQDQLLQRGYFLDWFLFEDGAMRISPPLTISEERLRGFVQALNECFDALTS